MAFKRILMKAIFLCLVFFYLNLRLRLNFDSNTMEQLEIKDKLLFRLQGPIKEDDKQFVNYMKKQVLIPPSNLPYNLSKNIIYKKSSQTTSWPYIQRRLRLLFNNFQNGYFVEAGALDGEYLSNTLWLERELNWTGLLIEPENSNFNQLLLKRRKAWISQSCLSAVRYPKDEVMVSLRKPFKGKSLKIGVHPMTARGSSHPLGYRSQIESIQKSLEIMDRSYYISNCYPLYTYLLALNVSTIDLLSLDIQGLEFDVFTTLPLDKITVRVVVIEDDKNYFNDSLVTYFNNLGFLLVAAGGGPDYIFINKLDTKLEPQFKIANALQILNNSYS